MFNFFIRWGVALLVLVFCGAAEAHPGHGAGSYMAGLAHPLLGVDHWMAMVAVGIWAAQLGGRATWGVPASFVAVMAAAGVMGAMSIHLPMVESGIAASLLLLGLFVAFAVRLPFAVSALIVGLFAVFHGYAHGAESPQGMATWEFGAGFVLTTAALHGVGLLLGRCLLNASLVRILGAVFAMGGAWLLILN